MNSDEIIKRLREQGILIHPTLVEKLKEEHVDLVLTAINAFLQIMEYQITKSPS